MLASIYNQPSAYLLFTGKWYFHFERLYKTSATIDRFKINSYSVACKKMRSRLRQIFKKCEQKTVT